MAGTTAGLIPVENDPEQTWRSTTALCNMTREPFHWRQIPAVIDEVSMAISL
jgi:hypothetical protein